MLLHLHIQNFAIVPALEQDFMPGFTAISGETGAGKSIMVDALTLLLGARSDASWVRDGADRAELSAEFGLQDNPAAREWLREHALDSGDECLLRRSIQSNGRSRAWINGTPVTIAQLTSLGNRLVEIHGQNEHVRLAESSRQLNLLDTTGDYADTLQAAATAFEAWQATHHRYTELARGAALPPSEVEFVRFQLDELEAHALPAEQVQMLEQEHRLQSSSGAVLKALDECAQLIEDDETGAAAQIQGALNQLAPFKDFNSGFADVLGMLNEALINTREAASSLATLGSKTDLDPSRLQQLERQLDKLGDLSRKHGVELDELEPVRDRLAEKLDQASRFDELREELERECAKKLSDYAQQAAALTAARTAHGRKLAGKVQKLMQELGMAGGRFLVEVTTAKDAGPSRQGADKVEFRVSANPGIEPGALSKVASGGELSRISLAIKVATSDASARTQVFDEIDAGVGGDTANAVGRLLKTVAETGQALCITHLAQVAVRADQQLKVSKAAQKNQTSVGTAMLEREARVEEVARMLGGTVSDQSRAHAREMLEAANSTLQ